MWFDISVHFRMITVVTVIMICYHTKVLHCYWLYSTYYTAHTCDPFILQLKGCILIPLSLLSPSLILLLFVNYEFSMSLFLFICFGFYFSCISVVFVFPWLTSLSVIPSGSIHVVTDDKIPFFLMAEQYSVASIFHCSKWGCNEHRGVYIFSN